MAEKPKHDLSFEISTTGALRLLIRCPHDRHAQEAAVYERDAALRMLAELEAEIRRTTGSQKPA